MAKLMLVTGLIVTYGYIMEIFMAAYAGSEYERYVWRNRMTGPYWGVFWGTIVCNVLAIQALWFKRVRRSVPWLFGLGVVISLGMWLERHMIVISSLHRDFLPSSWDMFYATWWDIATFAGTIGIFALLNLLFIRFLPVISIAEIREMAQQQGEGLGPEAEEPTTSRPAGATGGATGEEAGRGTEADTRGGETIEGPLHGWLAKFAGEEPLVEAAERTQEAGYEQVEAYTPMPVKEVTHALGRSKSRLPLYVLIGAMFGAGLAYGTQFYAYVIDYPLNVGGRAHHSWPAFIPLTFELAVLGAGLTAFFGSITMGGMPRLEHPIFEAPGFERSTLDQFMLCIEADDEQFDRQETAAFLEDLDPVEVVAVPEPGPTQLEPKQEEES
ncbi:MAG: quinol:electron acceptor oxidoreductase subunit ActD, partial [Bradymonadaceae bacterium]